MRNVRYALFLWGALAATALPAQPTMVAVASNFAAPAADIVALYEARTGNEVLVVTASTGKLYAQIVNGAPFDVFLAADAERPRLLEESGVGVSGTRMTYATGRLYLYSRHASFAEVDCQVELAALGARKFAIANPLTAPFGKAAQEYLLASDLWSSIEGSLVYGENIAQAFLFVATGNAAIGLVANSQLSGPANDAETCRWLVPQAMHAPIEQQAILLQRAADNDAAKALLDFLDGVEARKILDGYHYGTSR